MNEEEIKQVANGLMLVYVLAAFKMPTIPKGSSEELNQIDELFKGLAKDFIAGLERNKLTIVSKELPVPFTT